MGNLQLTVQQLQKLLPDLNKDERRISKFLYQNLALGKSISVGTIAKFLQIPLQDTRAHLKQMKYVEYDAAGEISAYRGVTLNPTKHYLVHNNVNIYTWCAFDTLFLAELLAEPVRIFSNCPTCGKAVACEISDRNLINSIDSALVMSFIIPSKVDLSDNLQNAFCCKVHFFCNQQCGNEWLNLSPEIVFFDLVESLEIARERNRNFLGKV